MNAAQKLYDAARRYCRERHTHWCIEYQKLLDHSLDRIGSGYTDEAYDTFPRYHALAAILTEVERIDAENLPEDRELCERLVAAGHAAESVFTKNLSSGIEAAAIADERQEFERMVRGISVVALDHIEPLPYRRVLLPAEVAALWSRLKARWGADGGYFFPLGVKAEASLQAFETEAFDRQFPPSELRRILHTRGVNRVYELREHGEDNYILDVDSWDPFYNGAEGFWFSKDLDWIMYCSHESSTTVGGILAEAVLATWTDASNHGWG